MLGDEVLDDNAHIKHPYYGNACCWLISKFDIIRTHDIGTNIIIFLSLVWTGKARVIWSRNRRIRDLPRRSPVLFWLHIFPDFYAASVSYRSFPGKTNICFLFKFFFVPFLSRKEKNSINQLFFASHINRSLPLGLFAFTKFDETGCNIWGEEDWYELWAYSLWHEDFWRFFLSQVLYQPCSEPYNSGPCQVNTSDLFTCLSRLSNVCRSVEI